MCAAVTGLDQFLKYALHMKGKKLTSEARRQTITSERRGETYFVLPNNVGVFNVVRSKQSSRQLCHYGPKVIKKEGSGKKKRSEASIYLSFL